MPLSDLRHNALEALHETREALRGTRAYVSNLATPTLRLGVTGLARSGKTVFITSLIRNLIEGGRLPFFSPLTEGRVRNIYLEPQPDDDVPRFAYEDHLAGLAADPPLWPRSTSRVSQLRVTIEYVSANPLRRALGTSMVHIDIVDYPGEWLIDLPLLERRFAQWSREALALARHPTRRLHAKPFLDFLDELHGHPSRHSVAGDNGQPVSEDAGPAAPATAPKQGSAYDCETIARRGAALFARYLAAARADDHALSIAGPGRFLMPGDLDGSPLLTFFPLDGNTSSNGSGGAGGDAGGDPGHKPSHNPNDELTALLARRYESYKSHVVKPFFSRHFVKLDRQIILVDAMAALNAGPAALHDLQQSLEQILACFRPGTNSWLSSLLFRRIDRLSFAATKADHLHHSSHDRLEAILRLLTDKAMARATTLGAQVSVSAMAALRSTREVEVRQNGDVLHAIQGIPLPGERLGDVVFDGTSEVAIFPGDLPKDPAVALDQGRAPASQALDEDMRFIRFRPPRLALQYTVQTPRERRSGQSGVAPHIRLDRALQFLIGDRLQ